MVRSISPLLLAVDPGGQRGRRRGAPRRVSTNEQGDQSEGGRARCGRGQRAALDERCSPSPATSSLGGTWRCSLSPSSTPWGTSHSPAPEKEHSGSDVGTDSFPLLSRTSENSYAPLLRRIGLGAVLLPRAGPADARRRRGSQVDHLPSARRRGGVGRTPREGVAFLRCASGGTTAVRAARTGRAYSSFSRSGSSEQSFLQRIRAVFTSGLTDLLLSCPSLPVRLCRTSSLPLPVFRPRPCATTSTR